MSTYITSLSIVPSILPRWPGNVKILGRPFRYSKISYPYYEVPRTETWVSDVVGQKGRRESGVMIGPGYNESKTLVYSTLRIRLHSLVLWDSTFFILLLRNHSFWNLIFRQCHRLTGLNKKYRGLLSLFPVTYSKSLHIKSSLYLRLSHHVSTNF